MTTEAKDAVEASYACKSYSKTAGDEAVDIREAKAADDTTTYDAWAFSKGVASADLTVAAADSAMSMTTAFAAVATLAAVAF